MAVKTQRSRERPLAYLWGLGVPAGLATPWGLRRNLGRGRNGLSGAASHAHSHGPPCCQGQKRPPTKPAAVL